MPKTDIPDILYDDRNKKAYEVERFFGKGGFAKCYRIKDVDARKTYAGKVISKKTIVRREQREKISQEIHIHSLLRHGNVVQFFNYFEDDKNIYIILELCQRRSMMEMQKRRRTVTDYECRYYINQITQGVAYLHSKKIIHRDLKLGNLFLDDKLHVKIGDFGLATQINFDGERKQTVCGTPNYIAPEMLNKSGHSYAVDVWSVGCVMYTLLVGSPPFETRTLKDTYVKIRHCDFKIPHNINPYASLMISAMLQYEASNRPTIWQLKTFEWMKLTIIPTSLPESCITMAPRFTDYETAVNLPSRVVTLADGTFLKANLNDSIISSAMPYNKNEDYCEDWKSLYNQLSDVLNGNMKLLDEDLSDENTDPAAQPNYWVAKWVDYSDKYGFGYELSDRGVGVLFCDGTKLILLPNQIDIHYIDIDGKEFYMTKDAYIDCLKKKIHLLGFFQKYMNENLQAACSVEKSDTLSRMPHLHVWIRTPAAIIMALTSGTIQFNFTDHTKLMFCCRMGAITYMDNEHEMRTYRFETILQHGIRKDIFQKIIYSHTKLGKIIEMYEE